MHLDNFQAVNHTRDARQLTGLVLTGLETMRAVLYRSMVPERLFHSWTCGFWGSAMAVSTFSEG